MVFINNNCANENDKLWLVFSSQTPVNLRCTLPCFLFHGRIRMYHAFWHSLVVDVPLVQSMWDEKVGRHIVWRSDSMWKYCPLNCIYSSKKTNPSQAHNLLDLKIRFTKFLVKGLSFANVMSIQNTVSCRYRSDDKRRRDICINYAQNTWRF